MPAKVGQKKTTARALHDVAVCFPRREGRCALATALSSYKFLIVYGVLLSMVKVVLLVYGGGSCMSQAIYFLMDVAILLGMSKVMIRTRYGRGHFKQAPHTAAVACTSVCKRDEQIDRYPGVQTRYVYRCPAMDCMPIRTATREILDRWIDRQSEQSCMCIYKCEDMQTFYRSGHRY